jgi:predicted peptidase
MHIGCIIVRALLLALAVAVPVCRARADEPVPGKQVKQTLEAKVADDLRPDYWLYLPERYGESKDQRWPLLLFLHGSGERGDDIELVKKHGPPKLADKQAFPFVIVSPQCAKENRWNAEALAKLLDEVEAKHRIDKDRVYVTGLSMGGAGTWRLAAEYPDRFAAIIPICGGGDANTAEKLRHLPIWVFLGAQDKAATIERVREMVDAVKAAGGNPAFTIYPEAGHDCWTATYNNPKVYDWLLKHKRGKQPEQKTP